MNSKVSLTLSFLSWLLAIQSGWSFYSPSTGRWLSRDPSGEKGGKNLYGFVGNNPIKGIDNLGLKDKAVGCSGTCGASIDDWILAEIIDQKVNWDIWKAGKTVTIEDYLKWANGNQRYKDKDFFTFSEGSGCGSDERTDAEKKAGIRGCGYSVTLCGKCVASSILGNIMYGIIGGYNGWSDADLVGGASDTKRTWGLDVDVYDEDAYRSGAGLGSNWTDTADISAFCGKFNRLLENSNALREGRKDGDYNDLSTCKPCTKKTKETRHGGNESPRRRP